MREIFLSHLRQITHRPISEEAVPLKKSNSIQAPFLLTLKWTSQLFHMRTRSTSFATFRTILIWAQSQRIFKIFRISTALWSLRKAPILDSSNKIKIRRMPRKLVNRKIRPSFWVLKIVRFQHRRPRRTIREIRLPSGTRPGVHISTFKIRLKSPTPRWRNQTQDLNSNSSPRPWLNFKIPDFLRAPRVRLFSSGNRRTASGKSRGKLCASRLIL